MGYNLNGVFSPGHWLPLIRRLPSKKRQIALSFDDGPTPSTTLPLISLLARYDARATFFLSGVRADAHPDLVEALVRNGHDIYGHAWEHIKLDRAGPARLLSDLEKSESRLRQFRPTPSPYLVRLPYAAGYRTAWVHQTIKKWNPTAQIAHWSHSIRDWDIGPACRSRDELEKACQIAADSLVRRRRLKGAVLLLHESASDQPAPLTPDVAPALVEKILERFAARGFTFVPIMPRKRDRWISHFVMP
jgi:peptidoglycan-N-acetylglucosamine deacetylase